MMKNCQIYVNILLSIIQIITTNDLIVFLWMATTFLFGWWDLKLHRADMTYNLVINYNLYLTTLNLKKITLVVEIADLQANNSAHCEFVNLLFLLFTIMTK